MRNNGDNGNGWAKGAIIRKLKKLAKKLGHSPSENEVKSTFVKRVRYYFSTWNNAKLAGGLPIRIQNSWSRERVETELRKLAWRLGYSPRAREASYGLQRAVKKYFGSWNEAKRAVGLEIGLNKYNNHFTLKFNLNRPFLKGEGQLEDAITTVFGSDKK